MAAYNTTEQLANLGYGAYKKEATAGTPVTPNVYFPIYKEDLDPNLNLDTDSPIVGVRAAKYQHFMGLRTHEGSMQVLAEPVTAQAWFEMLLKPGAVTGGSDPYTHPFTLDVPPNTYTIDILKGRVVHRFWGCEVRSIAPAWDKNYMKFDLEVVARGSFVVREISSVNTTTVNLKLDYDQTPTKGLVASDLIRIIKADGSNFLDTTVASITDADTFEAGASAAAFAAGDLVVLRAATPSLSVETPFMWGRTEFRFADTAANALSAAHTSLEVGSMWKLLHHIENNTGSPRSGSFDPAILPRLQGEANVTIKKFFDIPTDVNQFMKVGNNALVIRHFSGTQHELRITINKLVYEQHKRPLETGKLVYAEIDGVADQNTSDGQAFKVELLNAAAS